jgi:ABC-type dipeptide/oligopeptide/nickel transport system ATPase component
MQSRHPGAPTVPGDPQPLLDVERLDIAYRSGDTLVRAVKQVSFAVAPGERIAIVGESGSGKSTLINTIAGFQSSLNTETTVARLTFEGRHLDRGAVSVFPARTPGVSMVFQDAMTSLDPVWTIGSQLRAVLRATASGASARRSSTLNALTTTWLRRVGLNDVDRVLAARPYELSGGMRQRAMLAIALCSNPRLLIADEPTSALDASLSRDVMQLLVQLTAELGTTLVVVSHDILLCLRHTDRILVMKDGELVEDLPSAGILESAAHPYTIGLLRCIPTLDDVDRMHLPTLAGLLADDEAAA